MYFDTLLSLSALLLKPGTSSPTNTSKNVVSGRNASLAVIEEMLPLYQSYYARYGNDVIPPTLTHGAAVGCNVLMHKLDTAQNQDWFSQLFRWVVSAARRHRLWKGAALLIGETAEQLAIELPEDSKMALQTLQRGFWDSADFKAIKSAYPSFLIARDAFGQEQCSIRDLLEKWRLMRPDNWGPQA